MIRGPADLAWLLVPTLVTLGKLAVWLGAAMAGRALWERDLRRPGLLLGLAGLLGALLAASGWGVTVAWGLLLPETQNTLPGGWLTTERLQSLAEGAWTMLSAGGLVGSCLLAAAVIVDRGPPTDPDPMP